MLGGFFFLEAQNLVKKIQNSKKSLFLAKVRSIKKKLVENHATYKKTAEIPSTIYYH